MYMWGIKMSVLEVYFYNSKGKKIERNWRLKYVLVKEQKKYLEFLVLE
jgi:uncharacterized membrane-anchored protein